MSCRKVHSVCYRYLVVFQLVFFKSIGLSPWSINASEIIRSNRREENCNAKLSISYIGICYSILIIIVTLLIAIYRVLSLSSVESIESILSTFHYFYPPLTMLCFIVVILVYITRQKLLINFINNCLPIVDKNLINCADYDPECGHTFDYLFVIYFLSIFITIAVEQILFDKKIFFLTNLVVFLIYSPMIHYTYFINILKLRLQMINSILSKLGTNKSKISGYRDVVFNDIVRIKRAYLQIVIGGTDIVSFFDIPSLITIMNLSTKMVRYLYFICTQFIVIMRIDLKAFITGLGLFYPIILLTTLTTAITDVIKQNEETTRIIQSLRDRYEMDEKIFTELSKFYSQLWCLKIEFTCCDILPLDRRLLSIIMGTIATYLLISLQFYINESAN